MRDFQRGMWRAVRIGRIADASANSQRDKHRRRRAVEQFEHRLVAQREIAERRDVEERDFVCALVKVALRELDWLAHVAHMTLASVAHIVALALGDHEIARVI